MTREMFNWGPTATLELEIDAIANTTENIQIIGVSREGTFTFQLNHTGDGTIETTAFRVPDIPTFVTIQTGAVQIERGEFYTVLYLKVNGDRVGKLAAGYVSRQGGPSWPVVESKTEFEGGGKIRAFQGADPAAGAEISEAVALNEVWRLIAITFSLVTDANAADRHVHLKIRPQNELGEIEFFGSTTQPASTTRFYHCAAYPSMPLATEDNDILIPLAPNLILTDLGRILTETTNLQATDNFGIPTFHYEQFFEL